METISIIASSPPTTTTTNSNLDNLNFKNKLNASIPLSITENFEIKNILCLGSGYVGVLTMTVLSNYYPYIKVRIYDKFPEILEKWKAAGNELKEFYSKNVFKYEDDEKIQNREKFLNKQKTENFNISI